MLIVMVVLLSYANVPFFSASTRVNEGKTLIRTHWMGEGLYAQCAPGPESVTLGCWSTTFAQIAYYHQLQPTGSVQYVSSKGYSIKENLGDHIFDWEKFTTVLTDTTAQEVVDEVSRYCYSIATIVQKDFGLGRYMTKLPSIENIENRLNASATLYLNYKGLFQSKRKFRNIVIQEIEESRPLYLYYRNMSVSGSGHSVVLDGYRFDGDDFFVHLNFGWGGRKDGWYNLFEPIVLEGDTELRFLITLQPSA